MASETELGESRCEQEATISGLAPCVTRTAVNERCTVSIHQVRTLDEADRSEREVVRRGSHYTLHFQKEREKRSVSALYRLASLRARISFQGAQLGSDAHQNNSNAELFG